MNFERLHPQERDGRSGLNATSVNIACCACDYASNNKSDNGSDIVEERRAEYICDEDTYERQEAETYELGGAPAAQVV